MLCYFISIIYNQGQTLRQVLMRILGMDPKSGELDFVQEESCGS